MAKKIKILALAGSTRKGSLNKKLIKLAAKGAEAAGAEVTLIDLRDFPMPFYDGDLESAEGLPEKGRDFKKLMVDSDGILIASPEYNSGYSAVLKNAIDWASRASTEGEPGFLAFTGKYAALLSASPGALGGIRGLYQLREMLQNITMTVMPKMQAIPKAHEAFDENGNLKDEKLAKSVHNIGAELVATLQKIYA